MTCCNVFYIPPGIILSKKCSTAQSFICKAVTSYKIHTLTRCEPNYNKQEKNQESKCKKLNQNENENDVNKTFSTDFGQIEKNSSIKEKKKKAKKWVK